MKLSSLTVEFDRRFIKWFHVFIYNRRAPISVTFDSMLPLNQFLHRWKKMGGIKQKKNCWQRGRNVKLVLWKESGTSELWLARLMYTERVSQAKINAQGLCFSWFFSGLTPPSDWIGPLLVTRSVSEIDSGPPSNSLPRSRKKIKEWKINK